MSDWPSEKDLQQFHYECLQGMYFDSLERVSGGQLLSSTDIADSYYNYFAADDTTSLDDIVATEPVFAERERTPAAYVGPDVRGDTISALKNAGYELRGTDSWLGLELNADSEVLIPSSVTLEYIDDRGTEPYVEAFRAAYSGTSDDDPYGNLDEGYARALARAIATGSGNEYQWRFIQATEGNAVVGVATLVVQGKTAGCYGVGIVPSYRKRGIGRAIMDQLANDARRDGIARIFLQTESGSPVEGWYKSFGYRHLFDAGYVSKSTD